MSAKARAFAAYLCAALFLCACATPGESFNKVAVAKDEVAKVRRIALLKIPESQNITLRHDGYVVAGVLAGALGGALAEASNIERRTRFVRLINENKLFMGPDMAKALEQSLGTKGFEVQYHPGTLPRVNADKTALDYSYISVDADAILHVWFGSTGYFAMNEAMPYHPWATVGVRLLDARTKAVLYHETLVTGVKATNENAVNLPGCDKPLYVTDEELFDDLKAAVDGIKACQAMIARTIAEKLRPLNQP